MRDIFSVGWLRRAALILITVALLYLTSYFCAWSIVARSQLSWPFTWELYDSIPLAVQDEMTGFWMFIDPCVGNEIRHIYAPYPVTGAHPITWVFCLVLWGLDTFFLWWGIRRLVAVRFTQPLKTALELSAK
jgi:hypothetical protein